MQLGTDQEGAANVLQGLLDVLIRQLVLALELGPSLRRREVLRGRLAYLRCFGAHGRPRAFLRFDERLSNISLTMTRRPGAAVRGLQAVAAEATA